MCLIPERAMDPLTAPTRQSFVQQCKGRRAAFEADLEDFVFSSWSAIRVRIGEPYVLTARLSPEMPNGPRVLWSTSKGWTWTLFATHSTCA